jgi:hypothetical protein
LQDQILLLFKKKIADCRWNRWYLLKSLETTNYNVIAWHQTESKSGK